ncbi:protein ROOT PRIMORDIUM DEFECTIVE 1 [Salvia miltiorrhiza]|uniref:protein ROOT PRIMORDIUM DEFECTIVE 1 n=1 Tax=Salvia miltiorrhiza TaxID=226208 RepID=UPI0025ABDF32|nr:protein ROOT PRIMORDIUM DEFECTIVE 1 [Salvia miltiorrhiza]
MRILNKIAAASHSPFSGGPFTAAIQIRFKKPANTAQTRLETRTLDPKLDRLASHHRRLLLVLSLYDLVAAKKRGPFVSVNLLSRWAPHAGVDTLTAGELIRKYPHVFEAFTHPVRRNACCKFTWKFVELLKLEDEILLKMEDANVIKIKKILAMSENGRIHIHAIRLMRRELGLPENFRDSIIRKRTEIFRMVDLEIVELIDWDEREKEGEVSFTAEVEKWREREYREKWLSEFETKYAFPIDFPTGFKIVAGFKEKLKNWQRLSYMKPYESARVRVRARTCGGVERYEKRAVGIIHELLSLTEEKMMEVERLAHFKKDLGIMVNVRELLLKHPGIFYVATRGKNQIVFLREAYKGDCLVQANAVYDVRRKMLELMLLGCRNTRELKDQDEEREAVPRDKNGRVPAKDGDFVLPILQSYFK